MAGETGGGSGDQYIIEFMLKIDQALANNEKLQQSFDTMATSVGFAISKMAELVVGKTEKVKSATNNMWQVLEKFQRLEALGKINLGDVIEPHGLREILRRAVGDGFVKGTKEGKAAFKIAFDDLKKDLAQKLGEAAKKAGGQLKATLKRAAYELDLIAPVKDKEGKIVRGVVDISDPRNLEKYTKLLERAAKLDRDREDTLKKEGRLIDKINNLRDLGVNIEYKILRTNKDLVGLSSRELNDVKRLITEKEKEADKVEKTFTIEQRRLVLLQRSIDLESRLTRLYTQSGVRIPAAGVHPAGMPVYPQKGASEGALSGYERGLKKVERLVREQDALMKRYNQAVANYAKAGAAVQIAEQEKVRQKILSSTTSQLFMLSNEVAQHELASKKILEAYKTQAAAARDASRQERAEVKKIIEDYQKKYNIIVREVDAYGILRAKAQSTGKQMEATWIAVINAQKRSGSVLEQYWWRVGQLAGQVRMTGSIAIGALGGMLIASTQLAEQMHELSEQTGLSYKEAQQFIGVLGHFGASSEEAQRALRKLAMETEKAMESAGPSRDRFIRLGISLESLKSTSGNMLRVFHLVGDGLRNIGNAAERTALAGDLLGRSSSASIATVLAGSEKYKEVAGGIATMTEQQAQAMVKLGREIEDIKTRLLVFAAAVSGEFVRHLKNLKDYLGPIAALIASPFKLFLDVISALPEPLKKVVNLVNDLGIEIGLVSLTMAGLAGAVILPIAVASKTVFGMINTVKMAVVEAAAVSIGTVRMAGGAMVAASSSTASMMIAEANAVKLAWSTAMGMGGGAAAGAAGIVGAGVAGAAGSGTVELTKSGFWASLGILIGGATAKIKTFFEIASTKALTWGMIGTAVVSAVVRVVDLLIAAVLKFRGLLFSIGRFLVANPLVATLIASTISAKIYADQIDKTSKAQDDFVNSLAEQASMLHKHKNMIGKTVEELIKMGKTSKDVGELILTLHEVMRAKREQGLSTTREENEIHRLRDLRSKLPDNRFGLANITNKEVKEAIRDQLAGLDNLLKKNKEVTDEQINDAKEVAVKAVTTSQYSEQEKKRIVILIENAIEARRNTAHSANAKRMNEELKIAKNLLEQRLKDHQVVNEKEIEDFANTQRTMIQHQYIGIRKQEIAISEFNTWVLNKRREFRKQENDAELKYSREELRYKLLIGEITSVEQIKQYERTQQSIIRARKLGGKMEAAQVEANRVEIQRIIDAWNGKRLKGDLDMMQRVLAFHKAQIREEKALREQQMEARRAKDLEEYASKEAEIQNRIESGQISQGAGIRLLHQLSREKHAFEIKAANNKYEVEKEVFIRIKAFHESTINDLKNDLAAAEGRLESLRTDPSRAKDSDIIKKAQDSVNKIRTAILGAQADLDKDKAELEKADNDRETRILQERRAALKEDVTYKVAAIREYKESLMSLHSFQMGLDQDVRLRAKDAAEQQIMQFEKVAEAAINKADAIENAEKRGAALQKAATEIAETETKLRIKLLRDVKDAYRTEFDTLFDFLKEMDALSKTTLMSFRDALSQQIQTIISTQGATSLLSGELQKLVAVYNKVNSALNDMNKDSVGIGKGTGGGFAGNFIPGQMTDTQGNVISKPVSIGQIDPLTFGRFGGLKGAVDTSNIKQKMEESFKNMMDASSGLGGKFDNLTTSSMHLDDAFKGLTGTVNRMNGKIDTLPSRVPGSKSQQQPSVDKQHEHGVPVQSSVGEDPAKKGWRYDSRADNGKGAWVIDTDPYRDQSMPTTGGFGRGYDFQKTNRGQTSEGPLKQSFEPYHDRFDPSREPGSRWVRDRDPRDLPIDDLILRHVQMEKIRQEAERRNAEMERSSAVGSGPSTTYTNRRQDSPEGPVYYEPTPKGQSDLNIQSLNGRVDMEVSIRTDVGELEGLEQKVIASLAKKKAVKALNLGPGAERDV